MNNEDLESQLDEQIQRLNTQLTHLRAQKTQLSHTLLTSPRVQKHISTTQSRKSDLQAALAKATLETDLQIHQHVFGVTVFPYTDPSPNASPSALFLVSFFETQQDAQKQVVILQRLVRDGRTYLSLHLNLVAKCVDVEGYARQYLAVPDEVFEDDSGIDLTMAEGSAGNGQDFAAFVGAVRDDLRAWRKRRESIKALKAVVGLYGVVEVEGREVDGYTARFVWENGAVGAARMVYDGAVRRAIVFGARGIEDSEISELSEYETDDDINIVLAQREKYGLKNVQLKDWERILQGEKGETVRIGEMKDRLELLWQRKMR